MTYQNFKVETDADGIALVTWDIPSKSMNVVDETTATELAAIVEQNHKAMLRSRASSSRRARTSSLAVPI